jgi:tetratricopeptide (TPR) repeat protein
VALWAFTSGSVQADADEEALKAKVLKLNQITGDLTIDGVVAQFRKNEAETKKMLSLATKMANVQEPPFNFNAAYILGASAQVLKDLETAQTFYKICVDEAFKLQSAQKTVIVYEALINLYFANNKFEDALKACQEFLDIRSDKADSQINQMKPFIMERFIQSLTKLGKYDEAKKMNDRLIEADEGGWYFLQLRAWILREEGKFEECVEAYQDVLGKLKRNRMLPSETRTRLTNRIRYMLSGIYVDMKKVDKAADELKSLLKDDPDNATYHNDLGYIWADHDMNLEEAEKLIRKAIELDRKERKKEDTLSPEDDKDNPAYLDSLGWLLFKKKDYKEAKKYLQEAVAQKDGQHLEIMDHLADVLMAMGEKDEALKIWKKAVNLDLQSKRDEERKLEVEKKIKKAEESK